MVNPLAFRVGVPLDGAAIASRCLIKSLTLAPVPGHHEAARPNASVRGLGLRLSVNVVVGVFAESNRPATLDHPPVQIKVSEVADRYQPPVSVPLVALAAHRPSVDQVREHQGSPLPASPTLVGGLGAELPSLWSVDTVKADALASNLYRIAVYHRRDADDVGCERFGLEHHGQSDSYARRPRSEAEEHRPSAIYVE